LSYVSISYHFLKAYAILALLVWIPVFALFINNFVLVLGIWGFRDSLLKDAIDDGRRDGHGRSLWRWSRLVPTFAAPLERVIPEIGRAEGKWMLPVSSVEALSFPHF
jgi:hypothetical protein